MEGAIEVRTAFELERVQEFGLDRGKETQFEISVFTTG